jgi:hypothetical protein
MPHQSPFKKILSKVAMAWKGQTPPQPATPNVDQSAFYEEEFSENFCHQRTVDYPKVFEEQRLDALLSVLESEVGLRRDGFSESEARSNRQNGSWQVRTLAYASSHPLTDDEIGESFNHDGFASLVVMSREDVLIHPQTIAVLNQHIRTCTAQEQTLFASKVPVWQAKWESQQLKERYKVDALPVTASPAL